MGKKLYVGNLPYSVDDGVLQSEFSKFGEVTSAKVITDRATGRSKGFGFVEMADDGAADTAIEKLNGQDLGGRSVQVSIARPPSEDGGGRGGPRRDGGGGRGPRRDGGGRSFGGPRRS
jgi:RNA recognition motif-containing protein